MFCIRIVCVWEVFLNAQKVPLRGGVYPFYKLYVAIFFEFIIYISVLQWSVLRNNLTKN